MNTHTSDVIEAETTALAVREPQTNEVAEAKPAMTPAQARVESVADVLAKARAQASLLKLTPEEIKLLKAEFPDEAFKMGAGGDPNLIYIEHAFLRDRFDEALGMGQWALVRSRPHWAEEFETQDRKKAVRLYADCALLIRGCLVSEAIGDMVYYPHNSKTNYGDAAEGSETAAFRRCAKKIGVGLQAWKKDFSGGWKQRQREPRREQPQQQEFSTPQKAQPVEEPRQPIKFDEQKFRNSAEAWLEEEKAAWIKANTNVKAWAVAVVEGLILHTEKLDAASALSLFRLGESIDEAVKQIRSGKASESGAKRTLKLALMDRQNVIAEASNQIGIGHQEQTAFEAVYGPSGASAEEPAQPKAPTAKPTEWFWPVICPIPNAGQKRADYEKDPDTIEGLYKAAKAGDDNARKRLFGFANRWKPEPRTVGNRTYDPSPADLKFREALDAFLAWEEAKAKTGCAEAKAATEESDGPPF